MSTGASLWRAGAAVLAATVLFACADTADGPEAAGADTASADSAASAQQRGATTASDAWSADTVEVSLTEFEIGMPASVSSGPTVFRVSNDGSAQHNFEVEGQGTEEAFETNLRPGQTRTLSVELRPGTYEIYCPVQDHADRGMRLRLDVTE